MTGQEQTHDGLIEVPEHLKPQRDPSAELKHGLSDIAVGGGRFGQGVVEIGREDVGPQGLRQAAGAGSVETLGIGTYVLPEIREDPDHRAPSSTSELREMDVDRPRFDSAGKPEYPDEM